MNVSDYLSDNGIVLLALCSGFALAEGAAIGPEILGKGLADDRDAGRAG